jgi:hypothetical protein
VPASRGKHGALLDRVESSVEVDEDEKEAQVRRIARLIEEEECVARALTPADLKGDDSSDAADLILVAYRNAYIPGRETALPIWTREVLAGTIGPAHPANCGIVVEFAENAQLWTAPRPTCPPTSTTARYQFSSWAVPSRRDKERARLERLMKR